MKTIVTLLTDFGTADGFVGAMKGVLLRRCPDAVLVDISHDIPPQDIRAGARALAEAAPMFPPGTIHVAVVDPGVGTTRRPLLLASAGQLFIGPDNGLLTLAATAGEAWILNRPQLFRATVSSTFHGRDIFASVAGHVAAGLPPQACGSPVKRWTTLQLPQPRLDGDRLVGAVVHVDRFGNLITNLDRQRVGAPAAWLVTLQERDIGPIRGTFGEVAPGCWVAYIGSGGELEIAIRDGDAASALGKTSSAQVILRPCGDIGDNSDNGGDGSDRA